MQQYAESLREVKKAEADVRDMKSDAERQAAQLLRDAERQANALLEQARQDAEAAYAKALDEARKKADAERKKKLSAGEQGAQQVRARASGPAFKSAVDVILTNFEKHVSGK